MKPILVPLKLISEANRREHWGAKVRRKLEQQDKVADYFMAARVPHIVPAGTVVTLGMTGRHKLDDDNYRGAFKHVRDAIAKWFGVDDGTDAIRWEYRPQTMGKDYEVQIEIGDGPVRTFVTGDDGKVRQCKP